MADHHIDIAGISVGALLGVGKLLEALSGAQVWLASVSYLAAIVVAVITIFYKIKNKGK